LATFVRFLTVSSWRQTAGAYVGYSLFSVEKQNEARADQSRQEIEMDEKQVAKSVVKKLSALRATLSDEEQAALDRMVEGDYAVAHLRVQTAADDRVFAGADERVFADADEAVAHLRIKAADDRVFAGADERVFADADEAVAHLRIKAADERVFAGADERVFAEADEAVAHLRVQPAADAKVAYRVIYNPDDETYNVE
jgi:hypothetical protein